MRSAPAGRPVRSTERPRVLIVTHVAGLAAAIQMALQQAGIAVELADSGGGALARQDSEPAAVVLLDMDVPDMDGLDVLARLADAGQSGVIAIAADGAVASWLRAQDGGADAVVALPLALQDLVARVRALHRRRRKPGAQPQAAITIDRSERVLADPSGRRTGLTEAEFAALTTLLDAGGASVSREWLGRISLRRLLHDGDNAVDEVIDALRRKLAAHGAPTRTILSARGQGYVIGDPSVFIDVPEG